MNNPINIKNEAIKTFFLGLSLNNKNAINAVKRADVLKIITTFATVVVLTAVIKNIFEVPIKIAQTIIIGKLVVKAFFKTAFSLNINVEIIEININIPI